MAWPFLLSLTATRLIGASSAPASPTSHGYVYDLFRTQLNASDFVASTAQFLLVAPLRILLIVVAAWVLSRLGTRMCHRLARSLRLRPPILG